MTKAQFMAALNIVQILLSTRPYILKKIKNFRD
jgi:hypothetical protein